MAVFLYTRAATLKIYDDLKKFIFIFSVTTQALYIGYLIYALCARAGIIYANISFLALSSVYLAFLLIYAKKKKDEAKNKIETVSKIYRWTRIILKAGTLAATVYGIHIATTSVTFTTVLLAALTTIAWVLSILFELVRMVFERYYELIEAAVAKDTYPIRKIIMKAQAPEIESKLDAELEAIGGELKEKINAEKLIRTAEKKAKKQEKRRAVKDAVICKIKSIFPKKRPSADESSILDKNKTESGAGSKR